MYAVVEQGGKQYKVEQGDVITVELVELESETTEFAMDKVLLVGDEGETKIGTPYIEGAKVIGKFMAGAEDSVVKGPKLYPTYHRRRKNSKKRTGHRQKYMELVIDKIEA